MTAIGNARAANKGFEALSHSSLDMHQAILLPGRSLDGRTYRLLRPSNRRRGHSLLVNGPLKGGFVV